ncbi:hypothetical protein V8J88_19350 [Massilia sp. W12]|uniref:hypothetical protein n=1 Tax=Massilia sp. W12 TaxID=3126507 RepID=UPI0030CF9D74
MSNNQRKDRFLQSIPQASIDNDPGFAQRAKFNFSFFCAGEDAGENFQDWEHSKLCGLLHKLKDYGRESLQHWQRETAGKSGTVLAIYGGFPLRSEFKHPKHVPHQARWGRFRIDQATRLVGFILPPEYEGKRDPLSGAMFDCNTFYVVFLDQEHRFYKTEPR